MIQTFKISVVLIILAGCEPSNHIKEPVNIMLGLCDIFDTTILDKNGISNNLSDVLVAQDLGMNTARPHRPEGHVFSWNIIQPNPEIDTYDFELTDYVVSNSHNLDLIATVYPYAEKERSEEGKPVPIPLNLPTDPVAYVKAIQKMVERYDGDGIDDMPSLIIPVKTWELGNEPTCPQGDEVCKSEVLEFVRITSTAIKQADPDALLLISPLPAFESDLTVDPNTNDLFEFLFSNDLGQIVDVFGLHYRIGMTDPPIEEHVDYWQGIIGFDIPFWVTETGARDFGDETVVSDLPQIEAAWLEHHIRSAADSGVERLYWCKAGSEWDKIESDYEMIKKLSN